MPTLSSHGDSQVRTATPPAPVNNPTTSSAGRLAKPSCDVSAILLIQARTLIRPRGPWAVSAVSFAFLAVMDYFFARPLARRCVWTSSIVMLPTTRKRKRMHGRVTSGDDVGAIERRLPQPSNPLQGPRLHSTCSQSRFIMLREIILTSGASACHRSSSGFEHLGVADEHVQGRSGLTAVLKVWRRSHRGNRSCAVGVRAWVQWPGSMSNTLCTRTVQSSSSSSSS